MSGTASKLPVRLKINGRSHEAEAEPRTSLADFLRDELDLTGTHLGCEHGVCGICTILVNGDAVRSCLMLAVQADGAEILTVEGLAGADGKLHAIQESFAEEHGLQCGFCTPGFLMAIYELLNANTSPSDEEIRDVVAGQMCRCTGYYGILRAVQSAAAKLGATGGAASSDESN